MSSYPRTLVLVVCVAIVGPARADAQQASPLHTGGWIISGSGSIGRSHDSEADASVTHVGVQPTGLVFVTPRLAIGASLPLSYTHFSDPTGGHAYGYGIGPTARYYLAADTSRWMPFVGASVQPQWQQAHRTVTIVTSPPGTSSVTTVDSDDRLLTIDGSLGLTRLVAQHVGMTGELYYTRTELSGDITPGRTVRMSDTGARFGLTVFVH